jgi:hypothetical protein
LKYFPTGRNPCLYSRDKKCVTATATTASPSVPARPGPRGAPPGGVARTRQGARRAVRRAARRAHVRRQARAPAAQPRRARASPFGAGLARLLPPHPHPSLLDSIISIMPHLVRVRAENQPRTRGAAGQANVTITIGVRRYLASPPPLSGAVLDRSRGGSQQHIRRGGRGGVGPPRRLDSITSMMPLYS